MKRCIFLLTTILFLSCATTPPSPTAAPAPEARTEEVVPQESAEGTSIPGTAVILRPPAGFELTDRFPGFLHKSTVSSIMATEIPGPFSEVTNGISDAEAAGQKGVTILSSMPVTVDGKRAIVLHARQTGQGGVFKKWIVAVDLAGSTTLIVATYPEQYSAENEQPLRESLLGASFGDPGDPMDALAFTVTPVDPFGVAHVMGQNMVLTDRGQFPVGESDPLMVFGLSASEGMVVSGQESFALERFSQVAGVEKITIQETETVTIDGLSGISTTATGVGAELKTPLTIYQVMLFDGDGYCLIQAITPSRSADTYLPLFKQIANTFKMRTAESSK